MDIFSFILILFFFGNTKEEKWNQIVPLKTSKTEVNKILGNYLWEFENTTFYKVKEGKYYVDYSAGYCNSSNHHKWKVEKDIVLNFAFYPENKIPIHKIPYDLKKFTKIRGADDMGGYYKYLNSRLGLIFETQTSGNSKKEFVTAIIVTSKPSDKHLECE